MLGVVDVGDLGCLYGVWIYGMQDWGIRDM